MGVHVNLDVRWKAIDPSAWAAAYDETVTLLRAHPSQLMGYAWRPLLGCKVSLYTKDIERSDRDGRHWCVVGDRRSMRFAEGFEMSRDGLDRWNASAREQDDDLADIVLSEPDNRGGARVFGAKTQGHPYHLPIIATGLLIEARFPGSALVYGDIDEADACAAQRWADEVLGRDLPMPVLFDAAALLRRLSARWSGEALISAFVRRFRGEMVRGLVHAFSVVEGPVLASYVRGVLSATDAEDIADPVPSDLVQAFLLATGDMSQLAAIIGDAVPAEKMAAIIAKAGVLLPAELRKRATLCRNAPLSLRPDVSSLGSLLGAMYLDRDWNGPALDEGALETALSSAYPGQAAVLLQQVRSETKKHEETLRHFCDAIDRGAQFQAGLDPYQDVGELVALRSADALVPYSRQRIAAFAYVLRSAARKGDQGTKEEFVRDPAKAHLLFVHWAGKHGPTLTEYAWEWILSEEDPALIGLLLDLFCCEPGSDETSRIRHALLESRVLSVECARMMRDETAMAEGEAFEERARRAQEQRRARLLSA